MAGPLSKASMNKIHHLVNAQRSIQNAMVEIRLALGDSDVTDSYEKDLTELIKELETDLDEAWADRG
jgi:hypothetical protein